MFGRWVKKEEFPKLEEDVFITKYGTYCRTCEIYTKEDGSSEYLQAFQQNDESYKWSIKRINTLGNGDDAKVTVKVSATNKDFLAAMEIMHAFETFHENLGNKVKDKISEELELEHYKVFAMREGVITSDIGLVFLDADHEDVLPTGSFSVKNINDMQKARKDAKSLDKLDNSKFLSGLFNNSSNKHMNFDAVILSVHLSTLTSSLLDMVNDINRDYQNILLYTDSIREKKFYKKMKRKLVSEQMEIKYEWSIKDQGIDYWVTKADIALNNLDEINNVLLKLKKEGYNTDDGFEFLYRALAVTYIVQAKASFNDLKKSKTEEYSSLKSKEVKSYYSKAEKICRKRLGIKTEEDFEILKQSVISGGEYKTPKFLTDFQKQLSDQDKIVKLSLKP